MLKLDFQNNDYYQGFSSWMNYWGVNDLDIENGEIMGEKIINYPKLPHIIKSHIEGILSEKESG